jgi:hypothetical protein
MRRDGRQHKKKVERQIRFILLLQPCQCGAVLLLLSVAACEATVTALQTAPCQPHVKTDMAGPEAPACCCAATSLPPQLPSPTVMRACMCVCLQLLDRHTLGKRWQRCTRQTQQMKRG